MANIGAAFAPTYSAYMAARIFQCLGISFKSNVDLAVISTIFFDHERGNKAGPWVLAIDQGRSTSTNCPSGMMSLASRASFSVRIPGTYVLAITSPLKSALSYVFIHLLGLGLYDARRLLPGFRIGCHLRSWRRMPSLPMAANIRVACSLDRQRKRTSICKGRNTWCRSCWYRVVGN